MWVSASERVVLAVDGNSLVHRAYHSQARTGFRTEEGPRWAIRGLLTQLLAAAERVGPDAIVVGFDDPGSSLRRETWPSYKAHRVDKSPVLVEQLTAAVDVLRELGISVVVPPGLEADDVLASVARQAPRFGATTVIVTSDRDAFGLIDSHTRLLRVINGGVEASPILTPERLVTLLGVRPEQYLDFAALRGDPSDNLPGVRGIGPVTAAKLLTALGSAAAAFEDVETNGGRVVAAVGTKVAGLLAAPGARGAWELNRAVMAMRTDVIVDVGAGRLPLSAAAVSNAFRVHDLHWATANALLVLAHEDSEGARPRTVPPEPILPPEPAVSPELKAERPSPRARHREPPPVRSASDQLSFF